EPLLPQNPSKDTNTTSAAKSTPASKSSTQTSLSQTTPASSRRQNTTYSWAHSEAPNNPVSQSRLGREFEGEKVGERYIHYSHGGWGVPGVGVFGCLSRVPSPYGAKACARGIVGEACPVTFASGHLSV